MLAALRMTSEQIELRLEQLAREWDIERALEANGALIALAGILLNAFADVWFLLLPAAVGTIHLEHVLHGVEYCRIVVGE